MITINNYQDYARDYEFIVFRTDEDGNCWFYGAYNGYGRAAEVAAEIGGDFAMTKECTAEPFTETAETAEDDYDDWAFTTDDYGTGNAPCDNGRGCTGTRCRFYAECH